jgi:hypothetical protein
MSRRFHGISAPLLIGGAAVLAIVIGAAVALAIDSDDDASEDPEVTPTATMPAATSTPTQAPPVASPTPVPATPVQPTATAAISESWSIDFQRTGGFAGLSQRLSVASNGSATYEDVRDSRVVQGSVGAAVLAELRALIDGSDFFNQSPSQDAFCADCFNLSITVTVDGQTHGVTAVDIGLDAALKPLADRLAGLLQDGLAQ